MLTHKRYKEGLYSLPSSSGIPGMHVTCGSSKGNHPSAQRSPLPWERQKGQRRHTPEPCGQDPQPGGNQKGLPTLLLAPVCTAMSSMSPGAVPSPHGFWLLRRNRHGRPVAPQHAPAPSLGEHCSLLLAPHFPALEMLAAPKCGSRRPTPRPTPCLPNTQPSAGSAPHQNQAVSPHPPCPACASYSSHLSKTLPPQLAP